MRETQVKFMLKHLYIKYYYFRKQEDSQGVRLAKISLLEYGYNEIHIITEVVTINQ